MALWGKAPGRRLGGVLGASLGAVALLGAVAPCASGAISISATQGSPDMMQVNVSGADEKYLLGNPDAGNDYTFDSSSCTGCTGGTITASGSLATGLCSPDSGTVVVCDPAEAGDVPYRINLTNDGTHTQSVLLAEPNSTTSGFAFPAPITVTGSAAASNVQNLSPTNLTFNGGSAADSYTMGTGTDSVHGGGGVDTVSYAGYFSATHCATVTLDDLANDTVRSCTFSGVLGNVEEPDDNVFSDVENVTGGPGVDMITGDTSNNVLSGGGGKDVLDGGQGSNTLHADAGGATMTASIGPDTFDGDPSGGGDVSYANHTGFMEASTNDVADDGIVSGPGEMDNLDHDITTIIADNDGSILNGTGASFAVRLIGGTGSDFLIGSNTSNMDQLFGGPGPDTLNASGGNDLVFPGPGTDTYDGGSGTDKLDYSDSPTGMNLSIGDGTNDGEGGLENIGSSFENVFGGAGNDTITGDGAANTLVGGAGADTIDGMGNGDLLEGEEAGLPADGACDTLMGGSGNDTFNLPFDTGCNTTLDYSDHVVGVTVNLNDAATAEIVAAGETDTFAGGFIDVIGSPQADTISVNTSFGPHTLTGGLGNDTLSGSPGTVDTSSYADRAVPVTADLDGVNDDGQAGEADILSNIDNLTGGSASDTLTGDGGDNVLTGRLGNDILSGGPGGSDTSSYAERAVPVSADLDGVNDDGQAGEADTLTSIDNLVGGSAGDTLALGGAPGRLTGNDGGDLLTAGPGGGATIDAGNGDDTIEALNSAPDAISCGPGFDPVNADGIDTVAADCDPTATPPASPPAADKAAPSVALGPKKVKLDKKGRAVFTVQCPADETTCAGTLKLASAHKVSVSGAGKPKKVLQLGSSGFSDAGGATAKVKIRVSAKSLKLVKQAKKLAVKSTATVHDAAGNAATTTATHTLLAPKN